MTTVEPGRASRLKPPILLLFSILVLAIPMGIGAALSGGGTTIANAPTISSGQRVFGNTASELVAEGVCRDPDTSLGQWWLLNFRAADNVQISWENPAPAEFVRVLVYTAGTTDATRDDSRWIPLATNMESLHNGGASFAAPAKGTYPLTICLSTDGPYSLVVQIRHKARVFLQRPPQVSLKAKVTATVRDPDGGPITDPNLKLNLLGIWKDASHLPPSSHVLASASPKSGVATFPFKLPRKLAGTVVRLRVVGGGPDWQNVASARRVVRVARP